MNLRPGKAKLLVLVGLALFALVLGLGAGMILSSKRAQARGAHSRKKHHKGANEEKPPVETVYSLGELVVNLTDNSPLRYAKFTVALGIREKLPEEELKDYEPLLKDAVIGVVTKKSFGQLHRMDGLKRLKRELLAATENRIPKATVSEIYFEQFAMQ